MAKSNALGVVQFYADNSLRNFSYLIEVAPKRYWCIDPYDAQQVKDWLDQHDSQLEVILNTHEHFDHVKGNLELQQWFGCEVWTNQSILASVPGARKGLGGSERFRLQSGLDLVAEKTPGHTEAHLCFALEQEGRPVAMFTGDTLFNAGVGNCKNGGDPLVLYRTITQKFAVLPDSVLIYPGHEYFENNLRFALDREPSNEEIKHWSEKLRERGTGPSMVTTMGEERLYNVFLRLDQSSVLSRLSLGIEATPEQVFLELRKLRDRW
jgi:hydroxyacylglutathione hydrolase